MLLYSDRQYLHKKNSFDDTAPKEEEEESKLQIIEEHQLHTANDVI